MTTHPQQPDVGLSVAVDLTNRALEKTAAYPAFLTAHGLDATTITEDTFRDLPPVTKDNYILKHSNADLVWGGSLGDVVNWSASSGSTGEPTYWPRSRKSLYDSIRFHEDILRNSFDAHKHSTLVVNTFAMGNWIGGTYTLMAINGTNDLDMPVSIISPGMKVLEASRSITELGPDYEQVIIAGYPPFVKDVVDHIPLDALQNQTVRLLLAGEPITERWRTAMLGKIGQLDDPRSITLIYGTADAGMMGFETPASIAIRRTADRDPLLREALFGKDAARLPTLAEYDPTSRYAETDGDGFLLFTIDSTLPLIRYRIKDFGRLFDSEHMKHLVTSAGHSALAEQTSASAHFLTVSGRDDVEATLNGLNLFTANFTDALEDDRLFNLVTTIFYVPEIEQPDLSQRFEIQVELADGLEPTDELRELIREVFVETLRAKNGEYSTQYLSDPQGSTPEIMLAEYEGRSQADVKRRSFRKIL